nr:unnamed protein product [Callosobruchus analis]
MERRRGSFSSDSANIWITNLLQQWQDMGNEVDYFSDLDTHTVSWIVDPFKCGIAMIPEEPSGLAEAILELRSNTEARIQFESKPNLSSFWMSKAAKPFKVAREEAL